jgi:hypothetical protein
MKPYVVCHMVASLDGRINAGHWSRSQDDDRKAWSALYEQVHESVCSSCLPLTAAPPAGPYSRAERSASPERCNLASRGAKG